MSAIRNTLSKSADGESSKIGLLAYFSKGTAEDRANFFAREDEWFEQTRSQSISVRKSGPVRFFGLKIGNRQPQPVA
jgi:hypothetical protein